MISGKISIPSYQEIEGGCKLFVVILYLKGKTAVKFTDGIILLAPEMGLDLGESGHDFENINNTSLNKMVFGLAAVRHNYLEIPNELLKPIMEGVFLDAFAYLQEAEPPIEPFDIPNMVTWVRNYVPREQWDRATTLLYSIANN